MKDLSSVIENLKVLVGKHGFVLVSQHKSSVRFESNSVSLSVSYNEKEKSSSVFVGLRGHNSHELDNNNLTEVFGYVGGIHPFDTFVRDFLSGKGNGILTGDLAKLHALDVYQKKKSRVYTNELMKKQNVSVADIAWDNKDYLTFLNQIDLIGMENLPASYALKYKMAKDKIS